MDFSISQRLEYCYNLAKSSPCSKMKYGAILVREGSIVGVGVNTSPNPMCNDCAKQCAGGIRLGVKSGTRLELCLATHAEQWAILRAGLLAKDSVCYVAGYQSDGSKSLKDTLLPLGNPACGFYCTFCARLMWSAGVYEVVMDSVRGPVRQTMPEAWESSYATALSS